jgi:hypothetical protein
LDSGENHLTDTEKRTSQQGVESDHALLNESYNKHLKDCWGYKTLVHAQAADIFCVPSTDIVEVTIVNGEHF